MALVMPDLSTSGNPDVPPGQHAGRLPAYCGCCGCVTRYCLCSCCCGGGCSGARGNSFANGASVNNGNSYGNGSPFGRPQGWQVRPVTHWDFTEGRLDG